MKSKVKKTIYYQISTYKIELQPVVSRSLDSTLVYNINVLGTNMSLAYFGKSDILKDVTQNEIPNLGHN